MELLTEQLVISDKLGEVATSNGSSTTTGTDLDMRDYHRVIAYGLVDWTTGGATTTNVSASIKIQASTATTFGTATTIATGSFAIASTSTTGSTEFSVSCDGEAIQTARVAEDRYVRAVLSLTSGGANLNADAEAIVLRSTSRYKPS